MKVDVSKGLELNLNAVVTRSGRCGPGHRGVGWAASAALDAEVDLRGADGNADGGDAELEIGEADGHGDGWAVGGVVPDLCDDLIGGGGREEIR